jgi:hypothetical protein
MIAGIFDELLQVNTSLSKRIIFGNSDDPDSE